MKKITRRVTRKRPVKRSALKRAVRRKKTSPVKVIVVIVLAVVVVVGVVLLARSLSGGGGLGSGLGGKPSPLSDNVSYSEAMAKVDAIWAYCDAHPTSRNRQVKSASTTWRSTIQGEGAWSLTRSTYIKTINMYIGRLD